MKTKKGDDIPTYTFTYYKHTKDDIKWPGQKLFTCQATSILISDKMFEEATSINPQKTSGIGCAVKKEKQNFGQKTKP